jgi:RNA polymerase sigma-70 factor (ECF subfamily)
MPDRSALTVASEESSPPPRAADAFLVARAQRDPAAFAPLYETYFDAVYRYCYHRLGSCEAAEDAASIVFTNALAALPRYRIGSQSGSFRSWLFVIAHNVVANAQRACGLRPVQPLSDADHILDGAPSPEDAVLTAEASRSVQSVLGQLPPDQRQILELRLAGLTDLEISHVLGRTRGAVRTAQYRAVNRLRALLVPERGEARDD